MLKLSDAAVDAFEAVHRIRSSIVLLIPMLCGQALPSIAQEQQAQDIKSYCTAIALAQSDLNAGQITEAKKRLNATAEGLRGLEFGYLQARSEKAQSQGVAAPDLIQRIARPSVDTRYAALNRVTRQIAFVCRDGSIRIHDLGTPAAEARLVEHEGGSAVWAGAFSPDGSRFFSGHENGELLVWDAAKWQLLHTIPLAVKPVRELCAAHDGTAFIAEGEDKLELWSLAGEQPKKIADVGDRYNFGEGMAFSPVGDLLATGGMFDILLHDAQTGKEVGSMRHASYTMGLEFSPDGEFIASAPRGNVNKFLAVFDVAKKRELFNAGPFNNYVAGMAFTPDGKRIAATGCEKMLRIFDAATGEITLQLDRPECGANPGFTSDGRLLGWNEPDGYYFLDLAEAAK